MGPWPDPARGAPSPHLAPTAQPSLTASPQTEELLDLIASSQSRRLDDQRASVGSLPGLRVTHSNLGRLRGDGDPQEPGDDFFNMLVKCQVGLRLGAWGRPPPRARPCLPHARPVPPPCPPPCARPPPRVPLHLQAAQGPFTFTWGGGPGRARQHEGSGLTQGCRKGRSLGDGVVSRREVRSHRAEESAALGEPENPPKWPPQRTPEPLARPRRQLPRLPALLLQGLLGPAPDPWPHRAPWGASHLGLGELQPPVLPPGLLKASLSGVLGAGREGQPAAPQPGLLPHAWQ